jgi:hypothetical protein
VDWFSFTPEFSSTYHLFRDHTHEWEARVFCLVPLAFLSQYDRRQADQVLRLLEGITSTQLATFRLAQIQKDSFAVQFSQSRMLAGMDEYNSSDVLKHKLGYVGLNQSNPFKEAGANIRNRLLDVKGLLSDKDLIRTVMISSGDYGIPLC